MKKRNERDGETRENDFVEMEGVVEKMLNGMMYRVKLDCGVEVLGTMSGKMRQNKIRIAMGDRVRVEVSVYDTKKGRIVYRVRG